MFIPRYLVERGTLKPLPYGHKLRAFCALSFAVDWMRADLESEQITDRAQAIARGFHYAGMELLQRKAAEKWAGTPIEIVYYDYGSLGPPRRVSLPKDPEIRDMKRKILAELIPNAPSR